MLTDRTGVCGWRPKRVRHPACAGGRSRSEVRIGEPGRHPPRQRTDPGDLHMQHLTAPARAVATGYGPIGLLRTTAPTHTPADPGLGGRRHPRPHRHRRHPHHPITPSPHRPTYPRTNTELTIPATARWLCGIAEGLAGPARRQPTDQLLVLHPEATITALVCAYHDHLAHTDDHDR